MANALRSVATKVNSPVGPPGDFVVTDAADKNVIVEAEFRRHGPFRLHDVRRIPDEVERHLAKPQASKFAQAGILVVTNVAPAADVRQFLGQTHADRPIQVVSRNGEADNELLVDALTQLARQPLDLRGGPRPGAALSGSARVGATRRGARCRPEVTSSAAASMPAAPRLRGALT